MTFTRPHPKASAAIFVVLTCVFSWSFVWAVHAGLETPPWAFALVLMWIPGVVALVMRRTFHEGFADAGFRAGAGRYWLFAYAVPFLMACATYLAAAALQLVHITPYLKQQSMFGPVPLRLVWWAPEAGTAGLLAQRFLVTGTLGVAVGFAYALGEEIGWRGYLLPKLVEGRVRFPIFICGVVWGVWHMPFVLLMYSQHRIANALLYLLVCLACGVFICWLRLASGSLFVAAMAHSAYNAFFQNFYDHSFAGTAKWFWAGDIGLLCSLSTGVVALWLYRTGRLAPDERRTISMITV
jgi:membrane protease YdiL (CAAX protease family)